MKGIWRVFKVSFHLFPGDCYILINTLSPKILKILADYQNKRFYSLNLITGILYALSRQNNKLER